MPGPPPAELRDRRGGRERAEGGRARRSQGRMGSSRTTAKNQELQELLLVPGLHGTLGFRQRSVVSQLN